MLSPLWDRAGKGITRQARKWADYLNRRAETISRRGKWGLLLAFCFIFGSGGIYLLVSGFHPQTDRTGQDRISIPTQTLPTDRVTNQPTPAVFSQKEVQYLHWLRGYLDSLQQAGSPVYDSIIRVNPGLLNNLSTVESLLNEPYKLK
jgi:hypothetical protein